VRFLDDEANAVSLALSRARSSTNGGDLLVALKELVEAGRLLGLMEGALQAYLDEAGPSDALRAEAEGRPRVTLLETELRMRREHLASKIDQATRGAV